MPIVKWDPAEEMLLSVVNKKTVYGLPNPFDSDNFTNPIQPTCESEYIFEIDCVSISIKTSFIIRFTVYLHYK